MQNMQLYISIYRYELLLLALPTMIVASYRICDIARVPISRQTDISFCSGIVIICDVGTAVPCMSVPKMNYGWGNSKG